MYSILGATGRVGSSAATVLLSTGQDVRVVVRDEVRAAPWAAHGAEVATADLDDPKALARALTGVDGAFVLLPFDLGATGPDQTGARVRSITQAVAESGVPHVVVLSSLGAHLPAGTGPIVALHDLEEALRSTGTTVTALRPGHFQEKVTDLLDAARANGSYPVLARSADIPKPMVATRDIGAVVASSLCSPPAHNEVVDVLGPRHTERDVAAELGALLGRTLDVIVIPREGWYDALVQSGLPAAVAAELEELSRADDDGLLAPQGDRAVTGDTALRATLESVVKASVAGAS